ncbi:MAG: 16S rRNA processing protein RimM [Betaproteobacteria bacterium]|nr:16S rRNA processing protein RimM [Betaproteobacteria bacterium]
MAPTSAGAVPDDIVVMGQVLLPYGVKGWLRIRPHTESPDGLLQFKAWWLRAPGGGAWKPALPREGRMHSDALLVRLDGVETREAALALKGCDVGVPRAVLPKAGAGEIYQADLVGLEVVNRDGVVLGRVIEVADFGAHPLLRVAGPGSAAAAGERLIPYVAAVVDEVDLDAGRLRVDWGEDY